ncbi:hypothetical protein CsSME_00047978 [Camellia sinensis var. sinensis]
MRENVRDRGRRRPSNPLLVPERGPRRRGYWCRSQPYGVGGGTKTGSPQPPPAGRGVGG